MRKRKNVTVNYLNGGVGKRESTHSKGTNCNSEILNNLIKLSNTKEYTKPIESQQNTTTESNTNDKQCSLFN